MQNSKVSAMDGINGRDTTSPPSPVAGNFSELIASTSDKCLAEVKHVFDRSAAGPAQGALHTRPEHASRFL